MILRNFKLSDAAAVYTYAKNPKIGPIAGWPVHTSIAESASMIEKYFADSKEVQITVDFVFGKGNKDINSTIQFIT